MSGVTKEWLVVVIFFLAFFATTFAESAWLHKKLAVVFPRALASAFIPNLFTITVGFFVSFVIFAVILAMAWDGSLRTIPGNDATIWAVVIVGLVFPVILLVVAKRLVIKVARLSISSPWLYSLAASLFFFMVVLGLPILFAFVF